MAVVHLMVVSKAKLVFGGIEFELLRGTIMDKIRYIMLADSLDITQLTMLRSDGVQDTLNRIAEKYNLELEKADDGVTLALLSERDLTDDELSDINNSVMTGWLNYLSTK